MPVPLVPLVPLVPALVAGTAKFVAHSSGGLIINHAAAGGYLAGTLISSSQIAGVVSGGVALATGTAAAASGLLTTLIGSAGMFGTTIGASGITGLLMSAGLLPAVPVAVPVAALGSLGAVIYALVTLYKLRRKLARLEDGKELYFSDAEAAIIGALVVLLAKRGRLER